ncbi:peptidoglycan-associated lipoprotein Pal [Propionivibrio dicarboxylicus]|uniref:Peptidoglycan-associated lipoprotein n=1 Tax=Propionivibrio dicarboxylicus TaxID=83767 RepID=A0A1G8LG67_9RHOO|nr:peptidoglycan-associated lipoprotein Pal [Propionivibrio dicarboxylicus]SDI54497.1 peptidoglycan-associated lipoprotein [Propionivibrio dicarboxylicus]
MKQLAIPALVALLIAGCSSTPSGPEQGAAPVETRGGSSVATVNAGNIDSAKLPRELTDPKSILSKRSIYFDYDSYEVKGEYKDLVAAHAKFLSNNRQFKMLIQGNTDERGSREYNLALGQKRSDAVKKMLTVLGAREDQVESVSLGEEKPKNEGHDEAAWSENRRGDMLYSGEF